MTQRAKSKRSSPRDQDWALIEEQVVHSAEFENCYRAGTAVGLPLPPLPTPACPFLSGVLLCSTFACVTTVCWDWECEGTSSCL